MSEVGAIIADLVKAGVDAALVGRVAAALAAREPAANQVVFDEQAARRRRIDRLRKRNNWHMLRVQAFERDGYLCVYCGIDVSGNPQCDHVVPISRGGENALDNLATACRTCNSRKGARSPEEWAS